MLVALIADAQAHGGEKLLASFPPPSSGGSTSYGNSASSRSRVDAGAYDAGVFRSPESGLHTAIGTPPYCGPEMGSVVSGSKKIAGLSPFKQDMFACGVCLYAMITGSFPFGMNQKDRSDFQKLLDNGDEAALSHLLESELGG